MTIGRSVDPSTKPSVRKRGSWVILEPSRENRHPRKSGRKRSEPWPTWTAASIGPTNDHWSIIAILGSRRLARQSSISTFLVLRSALSLGEVTCVNGGVVGTGWQSPALSRLEGASAQQQLVLEIHRRSFKWRLPDLLEQIVDREKNSSRCGNNHTRKKGGGRKNRAGGDRRTPETSGAHVGLHVLRRLAGCPQQTI